MAAFLHHLKGVNSPMKLTYHETASVLCFSYVFGYLQETPYKHAPHCKFRLPNEKALPGQLTSRAVLFL